MWRAGGNPCSLVIIENASPLIEVVLKLCDPVALLWLRLAELPGPHRLDGAGVVATWFGVDSWVCDGVRWSGPA